jgi:GAF domain-containing protein
MRRRSKAGGEPAKTRRPKASAPKRRNVPKAKHPRSSLATRQETKVAQLARERDEASEQLSAASEIFKVISSSPGDLKPIFDAILKNATRICAARFGTLWLAEGDGLRAVAVYNAPPGFAEVRRGTLARPNPKTAVGRVLTSKQPVQVVDLATDAAYAEGDPMRVALVEVAGMRTLLAVPMLKETELVGTINIYRQEVRPFTDKQIALVQNFAAQAVIAIENTRLFNELRQRTADLTESLEQQTATAEVLSVISSSAGELQPVFQAMLENATRICGASFGNLLLYEKNGFRVSAMHGTPPAWTELRRREPTLSFGPINPLARVVATRKPQHIPDTKADAAYTSGDRSFTQLVDLSGARTLLMVPMLKEGELIGLIGIYRQEVQPFNDKQIALVTNFAAQAVIAIENARLLNELRQRTDDLSESLEQQTATSEVLRVISSSLGELEPVFQAMLANAVKICQAKFGFMLRYDGDAYHTVAALCSVPAYAAEMRRGPLRPDADSALGRVARTGQVAQIPDITAHRLYAERNPVFVAGAELGGIRTIVAVPMLKDNQLIGAITIFRQEVRPFTEKQVTLLSNFAAQAVIAIENARLLKELRERTEQLEAQSQEVVKLNQQLERRVTDQVGEIERMGRLRRFLPPQVADLIVASGTEKQLESHRREITALFCDLRGFTGFSESSDPEDVMALLREYHAAIGEILIKYSGTLERFAGDGVMVVFNDPVPVPNPALQAVQMALDMRVAIGALIEKWRRLGHDLGFGIGISHGFATLGTIGFEGRFDYAAIGTVSNVASRLCDEAKPGQILISSRVLMAVEDAVTVEPVGDFALKGIRRPMSAHNVLAVVSPKN